MEEGRILSLPDPEGKIACDSAGCQGEDVVYVFESVSDEALRHELEQGTTGQRVRFELTLGGTAAFEIVKDFSDQESVESLALEPGV